MKKGVGRITKDVGAFVTAHEQRSADFLARLGYDVNFIAPERSPGSKTADMRMDGDVWELKCPTGNSSRTIENILRDGAKQARNVVLDLRRTRRSDAQCIAEARGRLKHVKSLRKIFVITKTSDLVRLGRRA